jgi:hypothetical protein
VHGEKGSGGGGALDEAAELDELPPFAVRHRRVGDALKKVDALDHRRQELVGARPRLRMRRITPHVEEQAVDLLPHLRADLLAHLPRVLACATDARGNRILVGEIENGAGRFDGGVRTLGRRRRHPQA